MINFLPSMINSLCGILKNNIMKQFRITYRMEVTIDADSEEQAQEIFNNEIDVYDLSMELRAEYVEQISIEEL